MLEYIARGQKEREQRKHAKGWEGSRDGYLTEGELLCDRGHCRTCHSSGRNEGFSTSAFLVSERRSSGLIEAEQDIQ